MFFKIKDFFKVKKDIILHPLFFAIYQVIFLYQHNIEDVKFSSTLLPLIIVVFFSISVWWALFFFARQNEKAALYASSFVLLFFTYGRMLDVVKLPQYRFWRFRIHTVFIVVLILIYLAIYLYKKPLKGLNSFLNVMSIALLLISFFHITTFYARKNFFSPQNSTQNVVGSTDEENLKKEDSVNFLPDIYYIVLDAYARDDVLKIIYNFENDLTPFLKENNFYVATKSKSNYHRTRFSVPSALNYSYLDEALSYYGYKYLTPKTVEHLIRKNRTWDFLKKYDYEIIAFQSGYPVTEVYHADKYFRNITLGRQMSDFSQELLHTTPIPKIIEEFSDKEYNFDIRRNIILYAFDQITKIHDRAKPFFAFAHIEVPHAPFVFGPNGEKIDNRGVKSGVQDADHWVGVIGSREEYEKRYVDQVAFVNKKTKEMVGKILQHSKDNAIIIIQADHGPGSRYFYNNPEKSCMLERMAILNAYYFPDGDYSDLYPEISPVNTFRVILNKFFNSNLNLLKDESYNSLMKSQYESLRLVEDFETNCE